MFLGETSFEVFLVFVKWEPVIIILVQLFLGFFVLVLILQIQVLRFVHFRDPHFLLKFVLATILDQD